MKKLLILTLSVGWLTTYAQNLQTIKTYFDPYTKTHLSEVYTVLAGTPTKQGAYKGYDAQGILVKEATYTNGIANGPYKEYYSSQYDLDSRGKLGLSENYKKGKLDGISEEYGYPGGKKTTTMTIIYVAGDRVKETDYYVSGQKSSETDYKTGRFVEYYENGKKKEEGTYGPDGYKTGSYTKYYDNGTVMELRNDTTGVTASWFSSGQKKSERSDRTGASTTWYESGQKAEEHDNTGSYTKWYEDGKTMELRRDSAGAIQRIESYEQGGNSYIVTLTSPGHYLTTTFDNSGQKIEEAESKPSGKTPPLYYDGKYTSYYPGGKVKTTGLYYNKGLKEGTWSTFGEGGELLSKERYSLGQNLGRDISEIKELLEQKKRKLSEDELNKINWQLGRNNWSDEERKQEYERIYQLLKSK